MATREYSVPFGRDRASAIYTDAMSKMYGLVALGVIVTAAAIWVGDQIGVGEFIFSFGWVGMLVMLGALMGVIFGASSAAARGKIGLATVLYFGFTGLAGLYLPPSS